MKIFKKFLGKKEKTREERMEKQLTINGNGIYTKHEFLLSDTPLNGKQYWYNKDDELIAERFFKNNTVMQHCSYKNEFLDGIQFIAYDDAPFKQHLYNYKDGNKDKEQFHWNKNGKLLFKEIWENGKLISIK